MQHLHDVGTDSLDRKVTLRRNVQQNGRIAERAGHLLGRRADDGLKSYGTHREPCHASRLAASMPGDHLSNGRWLGYSVMAASRKPLAAISSSDRLGEFHHLAAVVRRNVELDVDRTKPVKHSPVAPCDRADVTASVRLDEKNVAPVERRDP